MTETTLLKGNSTPETFRVNDNATSAARSIISIQGAGFSSVKGSPVWFFCLIHE